MQKLWDKTCNFCGCVIKLPYIEVTTVSGDIRHYCGDSCRKAHSNKNVKQINYKK